MLSSHAAENFRTSQYEAQLKVIRRNFEKELGSTRLKGLRTPGEKMSHSCGPLCVTAPSLGIETILEILRSFDLEIFCSFSKATKPESNWLGKTRGYWETEKLDDFTVNSQESYLWISLNMNRRGRRPVPDR